MNDVAVADHPFERWVSSDGWVACQQLDKATLRGCGRPENDHAPAEDTEAEA